MKKRPPFLNVSDISKELTGKKSTMRSNALTAKHKIIIDHCVDAIQQIINLYKQK